MKGIAWTEMEELKLQLSFDKGKTWKNATIQSILNKDYAWSTWSYSGR